MTNNRDTINIIQAKLNSLEPTTLIVEDESHLHIGHPGVQERGGGHFRLKIKADCFKDLSQIACHRMIYNKLDSLMKNEIHALAIHVLRDDLRE